MKQFSASIILLILLVGSAGCQTPMLEYTNNTFNFSIDYPEEAELKTYGKTDFALKFNDTTWVHASVYDVEKRFRSGAEFDSQMDAGDKFKSLFLKHSDLSCMADGVDGCFYVIDPKIYFDENVNNYRVIKMKMTGVFEEYKPPTKKYIESGPFYALQFFNDGKEYMLHIYFNCGRVSSEKFFNLFDDMIESFKQF